MTVLSATHPTLAERLWPEAGTLRIAGLLLAGSALLALSAKVQIPVWPVPITMQTFAVLVIGMTYGRNLALGTVLVYLAEGAIGLPVFASGAGLAYFVAAPSAGYLIGFAPAAALVGLLAERGWDRSVPATLAAMALGTAVIFLFGVLGLLRYLTAVDGLDPAMALQTALVSGVLPYLPGALLKIALAAALLPAAWRLLGRR
ncbi:MAG: biotin transporter BioY [Gammaproteobacteria bacterium]